MNAQTRSVNECTVSMNAQTRSVKSLIKIFMSGGDEFIGFFVELNGKDVRK